MEAKNLSGHILVVEDQEPNRIVLVELLARMGINVSLAENGQEAIEFVESASHVDLVLMDLSMPVLDGIAATKLIRKLSGTKKNVPIVAMTANAFADDRDQCIAAGMNDFLTKPINASNLYQCIKKWVQTQISNQSHESKMAIGVSDDVAPELHDADMIAQLERDLSAGSLPVMVGVFVNTLTDKLTDLEQATKKSDANLIGESAHAIKSSAVTYGANRLAQQAAALEVSARAGNLTDSHEKFEAIQSTLQATVDLYSSLFLNQSN